MITLGGAKTWLHGSGAGVRELAETEKPKDKGGDA